MAVELSVVRADVTEVSTDVLLLKHAQAFYGADDKVAEQLIAAGLCTRRELARPAGEFAIVETQGVMAPRHVLFLGTPPLFDFRYRQMRQFAGRAVEIVRRELPQANSLACTVHGPGYGLDVEESLQAMLFGFHQALLADDRDGLTKITFVDRNERRADLLTTALEHFSRPLVANGRKVAGQTFEEHPHRPPAKKCVFVAMPFSEEFEDVYQFGIYAAVRKCGYVCEKVDESAFTGNIVERIQEGIRSAEFVVADLSLERPNVYLEVGFAWGLGKPVILVARDGQKLHFDLSHHKCLFYKTIGKLAEGLEQQIVKCFQSR